MGNQLFSNDASALLAATIGAGDTTVQVAASAGALFPNPGASQYFKIALVNDAGDLEICHCTSRSGDLLTVTRGEESTTPQAWTLNVTRVELRLTAGTMDNLLQKDGDTLAGTLEGAGNAINDVDVTNSKVTDGQVVNSPLRGVVDDSSNEVAVPTDGSRATASGSPIVTQADNLMTLLPVGAIILWYSGLGGLPAGWQICDGTNGSPDLRDKFVRGAGGSYALGATGGAATASGNTGSSGAHTHTGTAAGHSLTTAEIPDHKHGGWIGNNYERGINGTTTPNPATFRTGPVLKDVTRNDALLLDSASNTLEVTSASTPFTSGMVSGGGASAHTHSLSISSAGAHTHSLSSVSIIPPYHAVYYVMKVS